MKSDISGFPEFLPNEQIAFNGIVDTIKEQFESYGFVPMDTHVVERIETLLAKGNDSEIYGLYRLADKDDKKELGLRFDLTVPLARYISLYNGQLTFPYKRYQIAPVWRGERPQLGRYRQFYQCDIDSIGNEDLSIAHDAEIICLINKTLSSLNIPEITTKVNNRKILSGFLKSITDDKNITNAMRMIDKKDKISLDDFVEQLESIGIVENELNKLLAFLDAEKKGDNSEIIKWMKRLNHNPELVIGVTELEELIITLKKFGICDSKIKISTQLARGLTYYTGTVFETVFDHITDIGSIAAGGRYEDLAKTSSGKKFPAVGASIGISRLISKLIEREHIICDKYSTAQLLVTTQNGNFISAYIKLAEKFRDKGLNTEIYLQTKNLGAQLGYADKKGIKYVLIANDVELLENKAIIRNLETKEQINICTEYLTKEILDFFKR